jgi:mono/diheme cytochrome c family protein
MLAAALLLLLAAAGCRLDMHQQPRVEPLGRSEFFPDGQGARPLVAGTVPRGHLREDEYFYTGLVEGSPGNVLPYPVTREMLVRGQERYNVFCAPCHSATGEGNGMIVQRGFKRPTSFHDPRLRGAPPGYYFDVIARGFGVMPSYASQIPPADRWAIIAYVRALQLSQNARLDDVPAAERPALEQAAPEGVAP